MNTASIRDFKVGALLIDKQDLKIEITLIANEHDGVWIGRCASGEKCVFEIEAGGYYIK